MVDSERSVKIIPTRLRLKISRLTRSTENSVDSMPSKPLPSVPIVRAPISKSPIFPVNLPPALIGTIWPCSRPMRRLKNIVGTSKVRGEVKSKLPSPSRKNSRFSGKNKLNLVRFTWRSSTSTWAKSVLYVKSAVRLFVRPSFTSSPASPSKSSLKGGEASRLVVTVPKP